MPESCDRSGRSAAARRDLLAQGGDADAVAEIAEAFARPPLARRTRANSGSSASAMPAMSSRSASGWLSRVPCEIAADIERIEARHPADDADIAAIGPGAAVRAAGDADAEPLAVPAPSARSRAAIAPTMSSLHPLRLGQRQPAARQGRARQRPALDRQHVLGEPHAVRAQHAPRSRRGRPGRSRSG